MTLLPLLLAAAAAANDFSVANTLGAIRDNAGNMRNLSGQAARGDARANQDAFARDLAAHGIWGGGKADSVSARAAAAQAPAVTPINLGFAALGTRGAKGRIKGPHPLGFADGAYQMVANDPYLVVIYARTGYIDGQISIRRDPLTGKDMLGFAGRLMENGSWSATRSGINDGVVAYDPASDSGTIRWLFNGQWKQDVYAHGRSGARAMRIGLSGHPHDFFQE